MPHVIVKIWPGATEEQKARLAEQIAREVKECIGSGEAYTSVDIVEINSSDWAEEVYRPEIVPNMDRLYKKPEYQM